MVDYSASRWDSSVSARFWSKVQKEPGDGCWEWTGTLTPGGYGQFSIDNKHYAAHRLLKTKTFGAIPPEIFCDHLCRNRKCVNPSHIDLVSNRENIMRGLGPRILKTRNKSITHCPRGHEYTPENTRLGSKRSRTCKTCERSRLADWWSRKRAGIIRIDRARANGSAGILASQEAIGDLT